MKIRLEFNIFNLLKATSIGVAIFTLFLPSVTHAQIGEFYHFQKPNNRIYLPEGWGFLEESRGEVKFVSHDNGVIGSILRVKDEQTQLSDAWEITEAEAKKPYSSEVQLQNFELDRVTILGTRAIKMSFNCNLGGKNWLGLVYNSINTEKGIRYLNTIFFLVPEGLVKKDLLGANRISNSYFNFIELKRDERVVKGVVIPCPDRYDYFDQSIYQEMSIYDYTKSNLVTAEVVNFDLLVPNKSSSPFLHIYSQNILFERTNTESEFDGYKKYWKDGYQNGAYDVLIEEYFRLNILPNVENLNAKIGWVIFKENPRVLTIQTFVEGDLNGKSFLKGVVSNFVLLKNGKVVMIKANMDVTDTKDYDELVGFSTKYINEFLKLN